MTQVNSKSKIFPANENAYCLIVILDYWRLSPEKQFLQIHPKSFVPQLMISIVDRLLFAIILWPNFNFLNSM